MEPPAQDDALLVEAARGGDHGAFAVLLDRHARTLHAVARAVGGAAIEPEEVAAESAWRAWSGIAGLGRPERFGSWLRGIAANVTREIARRRRAGPRSLETLASEPSDRGRGDPAAEDPAAARRAAVLAALQRLPEIYREALVLKHLEDLSYAEMARALGISPAGVNQRLTRARRRLAEEMRRSETLG